MCVKKLLCDSDVTYGYKAAHTFKQIDTTMTFTESCVARILLIGLLKLYCDPSHHDISSIYAFH